MKATVTNLVRDVFEELFKDQLAGIKKDDLGHTDTSPPSPSLVVIAVTRRAERYRHDHGFGWDRTLASGTETAHLSTGPIRFMSNSVKNVGFIVLLDNIVI